MLTIKQIKEDKEAVVRKLAKKGFDAAAIIDEVLALDDKRKTAQQTLDNTLAEQNALAKEIGGLMKSGNKEEAEVKRARVAELKAIGKELDEEKTVAESALRNLLLTIPNLPADIVPEGKHAEDNLVVKMGGEMPKLSEGAVPHWDLAKTYDLIDFELGVKISGAGFPVYKGYGARLQRALINFFLDKSYCHSNKIT